jgi:hypothetical protein
MTKDVLQMVVAASLLATSLYLLFRYVKPRRSQADLIISLLNSLGESNAREGKTACRKKRKS